MNEVREIPKITWRDNFFITHVASEFPFVGGFFQTPRTGQAVQHAIKYSAMLLGGTTIMMSDLMSINKNDSSGVYFLKMSILMMLGMTAGTVAYNLLRSTGKKLLTATKECCQFERNTREGSYLLS